MNDLRRQTTVDWFRVIWDLAQRGYTAPVIARETGIGVQTVYEYRDGGHPSHWRGELLIGLWCVACDLTRDEAPTTELVLTPRVVRPKPHVQADDDSMHDLQAVTNGWRAGS